MTFFIVTGTVLVIGAFWGFYPAEWSRPTDWPQRRSGRGGHNSG